MKNKTIKIIYFLVIAGMLFLSCTDWDLGEEDPPVPVNLEITAVTDSTVSLRWSQSEDEDFKSYMVYYSLSDVVDTTDNVADTMNFSHDTVKTVSGLEPEKHYYFRVIVTTHRTLISASNIVDTTTLKNINSLTLKLYKPFAVSESSIALKWEKGWVSQFNRYFIYYDTTSTVDSTDICIDTVDNAVVDTVHGLKRKQSYWFRVYMDMNGISKAGSNIDSATTLDGKPKPVVLTVDRQSIIDTAITLKWGRSSDADFSRYLLFYDTVAKLDTFTVFDTTDSNVFIISSVNDTVKAVMPLKRKKKYWFAVYVQDTSKYITASNVDSATTGDGLPEPPILSVGAVTDTSAELIWSKNTENDFYRYAVYYSDTSYGLDTFKVIDTNHSDFFSVKTVRSDTSDTVMPLKRNTTYYFIVYTADKYGLLSHSSVKSAKTDDGMPEPVRLSIDTGSITDTSVKLTWTKSPDIDFKNYSIYFDFKQEVDSSDSLLRTIQSKDTTGITVTGLAPHTRYWFKVYVTSVSGQKAGSNSVYNFPVILSADIKSAPRTDTSDTTVIVRWTMSFCKEALFKRYVLYRSTNPNVAMQGKPVADYDDISQVYFADTIASPDTVYYRLYHFAINDEGQSEVRKSNEIRVNIFTSLLSPLQKREEGN